MLEPHFQEAAHLHCFHAPAQDPKLLTLRLPKALDTQGANVSLRSLPDRGLHSCHRILSDASDINLQAPSQNKSLDKVWT